MRLRPEFNRLFLLQDKTAVRGNNLPCHIRSCQQIFESAGDIGNIADITFRNRRCQGVQFILSHRAAYQS